MDAEPPFGEAVRRALLLSTCPLSFWDIVARREEGDVIPVVTVWGMLKPFAPWLLGALALGAAWLYVGHLQTARDAALAGQAATMQALGTETAARKAVTAALVNTNAALAEREAAQRALEARLHQRRGELDGTLDAPDVKPWAAARVPADVLARLRTAAADGDDGRGADATAGAAADAPAAGLER